MASFDYTPLSGKATVTPADVESNVLKAVRDVIGGTAFSGGVATSTYTPRGIDGDSLNRPAFKVPNSRKQEPYALHVCQLSLGVVDATAKQIGVPFRLAGVAGNALLTGIRFHHGNVTAATGTVLGWLEVDGTPQYFMTSTPSAFTTLAGATNLSLDSFVSTPYGIAPAPGNVLWFSATSSTGNIYECTLTLVFKIPHVS